MNSEEAIQTAFVELCASKSYEHITVKELCERAPVARTTFYAHYRNIDEVDEIGTNHLIDRVLSAVMERA